MRAILAGLTTSMLAASAALATTSPAPGTPAAPTGGIGDYWWLIIVLVLVAVAIWYFMRGRTGPRL
jgi:LPXTG-motif cell wall-anchored protein